MGTCAISFLEWLKLVDVKQTGQVDDSEVCFLFGKVNFQNIFMV
jgi:hypothetical protein